VVNGSEQLGTDSHRQKVPRDVCAIESADACLDEVTRQLEAHSSFSSRMIENGTSLVVFVAWFIFSMTSAQVRPFLREKI
jgi:hypothetical protein